MFRPKVNFCIQCGKPLTKRSDVDVPPHCLKCLQFYDKIPRPMVGVIVETKKGIVLAGNSMYEDKKYIITHDVLPAGISPEKQAIEATKKQLNLDCTFLKIVGAYSIPQYEQVIMVYHAMAKGKIKIDEKWKDHFIIVPKETLLGWKETGTFDVPRWIEAMNVLA
jgi:NAD+ diphosphatase